MAAYYPACVVDFKLRFDEALTLAASPSPRSLDQTLAQSTTTPGLALGEPLILQRGSANTSWVYGRVPKKLMVSKNGYRQAGTFEMTIDFKDLPIDPRTARAAAVEIHLGAVAPADFARGMAGGTVEDGRALRRLSQLRTRDAAGQPRADTLIMVGLVDEWEAEHGGAGSEVTVKGRDLRSLLIDSPLMSAVGGATHTAQQILESIFTDQAITDVVSQILAYHPLGDEFVLAANAEEWPGGRIPAAIPASAVPRHRRGARGTRAGGRGNTQGSAANMTFWDAIVQFCYLVGAIPHFQGRTLRIRPARSIFDQQRAGFDPRVRTPFAGGRPRETNGDTFSVRRLLYGRDTERVRFSRKFAGNQRPRVIRVVSTDLSNQERGLAVALEARWPMADAPERTRSTRAAPGGQAAQEEVVTIPVAGVRDSARLQEIARNVFEEIGRNEMGGTCDTKNLASFGGDNADPDLLRLDVGDAVEFYTDTRELRSEAPLVSALTDFERVPFAEAVAQVRARIGDENLARVIVATARGQVAQIQRFFRVANVKYDWTAGSSGGGIAVSFDFQNYFVSRQVADSVGQRPGEVRATVVPTRRGTAVTFTEGETLVPRRRTS